MTVNSISKNIPSEIWRLCYNEKELIDAILNFTNLDQTQMDRIKLIGANIRESYFDKPTERKVRKLLVYSLEGGYWDEFT